MTNTSNEYTIVWRSEHGAEDIGSYATLKEAEYLLREFRAAFVVILGAHRGSLRIRQNTVHGPRYIGAPPRHGI